MTAISIKLINEKAIKTAFLSLKRLAVLTIIKTDEMKLRYSSACLASNSLINLS